MKCRLIVMVLSIDLTPRLLDKKKSSHYQNMFINKNSDSLFYWFCKLLLKLWRTRIRSGLTVSSLGSRPGLFTTEICLGHCVVF